MFIQYTKSPHIDFPCTQRKGLSTRRCLRAIALTASSQNSAVKCKPLKKAVYLRVQLNQLFLSIFTDNSVTLSGYNYRSDNSSCVIIIILYLQHSGQV